MATGKSLPSRVLALLGSLRLATVLLVLLMVGCVIGGLLPQSSVTPNADAVYRAYGPFWYRLITRLRLYDVFHSTWFFSLTGLFALNLALCTGRRAHCTIARVFGRPLLTAIPEENARTHTIPVRGKRAELITFVTEATRRAGYGRVNRTGDCEEHVQLLGRRRRWAALGPDLVHVGILIILAGALLGIFREEGTFRVNEWEKGLRLPACDGDGSADCISIPYDVQVDNFGVETYAETGRAKSYWADLAFWDGDDLAMQGRISVNRPLTIRGMGFYAWRYGEDVRATLVRLHVLDRARGVITTEVELRVGETLPVPGARLWVTALQFYRTFALSDEGDPVDLGSVPGGHSAVLLQVTGLDEDGRNVAYRDLALPFLPETTVEPAHAFLLADARCPAFIELHFARNPGYPVFWWGFVLVMVGLAAALYFRPSAVRISIEPDRILVRAVGRGRAEQVERLARDIADAVGLDSRKEAEA